MPDAILLAGLSETGRASRRADHASDSEGKSDARASGRFEGFLDSLLGASRESGAGRKRDSAADSADREDWPEVRTAADKLPKRERQALNKAIAKTAKRLKDNPPVSSRPETSRDSPPQGLFEVRQPIDDAIGQEQAEESGGEIDPETMAAAEEAAALIWSMLFSRESGADEVEPQAQLNQLKALSDAIAGHNGTPGENPEAETAPAGTSGGEQAKAAAEAMAAEAVGGSNVQEGVFPEQSGGEQAKDVTEGMPAEAVAGSNGHEGVFPEPSGGEQAKTAAEAMTAEVVAGSKAHEGVFPEQSGGERTKGVAEPMPAEAVAGNSEAVSVEKTADPQPTPPAVRVGADSGVMPPASLASANVNAELNIDAMMEELDRLLEGIPGEVLEKALASSASTLNLSNPAIRTGGTTIAALAEALGLQEYEMAQTDVQGNPELLARLAEENKARIAAAVPGSEPVLADSNAESLPGQEVSGEPPVVSAARLEERPGQPEKDAGVSSLSETVAFERKILSEKSGENSPALPITNGDAHVFPEAQESRESGADEMSELGIPMNAKELHSAKPAVSGSPEKAGTGVAVSGTEQADDFVSDVAKFLHNNNQGKKETVSSPNGSDVQAVESEAGAELSESRNPEGADSSFSRLGKGDTEFRPVGRVGAADAEIPVPVKETLEAPAPSMVQGGDRTGASQTRNSAAGSSMAEQMQNIERLSEAMRMSARRGMREVTLTLSPPELGKVTMRVQSRGGVVSALLEVEKAEAKPQLLDGLGSLRENLKAQGVELGKLEVRHHAEQQAMGDGGYQRGRADDGREQSRRSAGREPGDEVSEAARTKTGSMEQTGGLNVMA